MFEKFGCIECDSCGCCDYYPPVKRDANRLARENGWIVTGAGRHYCNKRCQAKDAGKPNGRSE